jgi:FecR protein
MFDKIKAVRAAFLMAFALCAGSAASAQDAAWRVSKASGDVWFSASGAQPVALTGDAVLNPGDTVRTGQNGRVLLVRGAETMLISANSVIGLPTRKQDGLQTTILQRAGSILLDVEKRNVQHFEVATPYLAAVVKGTQFRVTVSNTGSHVDVLRGQVQVTDYKTGQFALVNASQAARVSVQGPGGLSLTGAGTLNPIQHGTPGRPLVTAMTVASIAAPVGARTITAQNAPQAPAAAPVHPIRWAPSEESVSNYGWASDLVIWGKKALGMKGAKSNDSDVAIVLAFPLLVGFSVAVGAATFRRKRKQQPPKR